MAKTVYHIVNSFQVGSVTDTEGNTFGTAELRYEVESEGVLEIRGLNRKLTVPEQAQFDNIQRSLERDAETREGM